MYKGNDPQTQTHIKSSKRNSHCSIRSFVIFSTRKFKVRIDNPLLQQPSKVVFIKTVKKLDQDLKVGSA